MIAHSEAFEAVVTRRVRELVAADPAMRAEYRQRHAWRFWQRAIYCLLTPLLVLTALTLFPAALLFPLFFVVLIAVFPVPGGRAVVFAMNEWPFTILAMATAGLVCLFFTARWKFFLSERSVRVFSFLPVSDRDLLNRALREWWLLLAYHLYVIAIPYAALAWREELLAWQWGRSRRSP